MKTSCFCFLFSLLFPVTFFAQSYDFQLDQAPYEDLTNATNLTDNLNWDDDEFDVPLGFTLSFFGIPTDTITIADYAIFQAGWIDVFYADLVARGAGNSPISYKIDGSPGNQIFKIEWKNAGFFCEQDSLGTTNDFLNAQLWLYEQNNQIEMRIGPSSITQPGAAYCLETGALFGLFKTGPPPEETIYLTGDPAAPTVFTTFDAPITGTPEEGTVYRFIPSSAASSTPALKLVDRVRLYPNPLHKGQTLLLLNNPPVDKIELFDKLGRIYTVVNQIEDIDWSNLQTGMYFLKIWSSGTFTIEKVILQ